MHIKVHTHVTLVSPYSLTKLHFAKWRPAYSMCVCKLIVNTHVCNLIHTSDLVCLQLIFQEVLSHVWWKWRRKSVSLILVLFRCNVYMYICSVIITGYLAPSSLLQSCYEIISLADYNLFQLCLSLYVSNLGIDLPPENSPLKFFYIVCFQFIHSSVFHSAMLSRSKQHHNVLADLDYILVLLYCNCSRMLLSVTWHWTCYITQRDSQLCHVVHGRDDEGVGVVHKILSSKN